MKNEIKKSIHWVDAFLGFILGVLIILCSIVPMVADFEYKLGQTDALTGKIKYELSLQTDSIWIEKEITDD